MPLQFHPEPPASAPKPVVTWTLRGLGLVGIAVVSGLVWWYVTSDGPQVSSPPPSPTPQVTGEFNFVAHAKVSSPRVETNCASHAYGKVQEFLNENQCQRLTRGLYTTKTTDGRRVYTSVAVVRMPTIEDAKKLKATVDANATGNVNDLIKEKVVTVPNLSSLSKDGEYASSLQDRDVIIVESDFDPENKGAAKPTESDEQLLKRISTDAIRLGELIKS